jgi:glycerate-2-kinase
MARAVSDMLGQRIMCGFIATPESGGNARLSGIEVVESGHPVPDRRGVRAARRVLEIASSLTRDDLLIVLLSGGASSLLPMPEVGLTLADKQRTTRLLLGSGATISEVNTVRTHLSAIKGGRLAAATQAQVLTLVLSDVEGDDLGAIGSGPTAPDRTTFSDAAGVVRRYGLWHRLPVRARIHLVEGMGGWQQETPKMRSPVFRRVHHVVVGNNRDAVGAAGNAARASGYDTLVLDKFLAGEASEVGRWMGEWGRDLSGRPGLAGPLCVVGGGELTVTVRGKGLGGRAQEFALAAAMELEGARNVWVIGFGTDGRDGPTDVAGAVVDGGTVERAKRRRLDAAAYRKRNDSYNFFKRIGGHIVTGPTGTNVNDVYLILVHPTKRKR